MDGGNMYRFVSRSIWIYDDEQRSKIERWLKKNGFVCYDDDYSSQLTIVQFETENVERYCKIEGFLDGLECVGYDIEIKEWKNNLT